MRQGPGQATATPAGAARRGRGEQRMVPAPEPRSYYGQPIIKQPVWTWEIPVYFFTGGIAGGAAVLAAVADATGRRELARRAWPLSLAAAAASPLLLISDLGRPERFVNMLRVVKVTSPMSVGTWVLTSLSGSTAVAAAHELLGWFPRLGLVSRATAGLLGPFLATYTAVLLADTAVPVWHEARRVLPFVFGGGAAASAGAAVTLLTPVEHAGPARRLAVLGALTEVAAAQVMERRTLGELAGPYREGAAGRLAKAALGLSAGGAALLAGPGRRNRALGAAGAALVLGGALCQRWSVFRAGFQSARDPRYTVAPQRRRAYAH